MGQKKTLSAILVGLLLASMILPSVWALITTDPELPTFTLAREHGQILKIIIDHDSRSWSPFSYEWIYGKAYHYEIMKMDDEFKTQEGKIVDPNKVYAIDNSLVNLHISGGLKTIPGFLARYWSRFRVEIFYENDDRVILHSDSGHYGNVPWNVVAQGKLFVQYTAEISISLFDLLSDIDPENWKPFEWESFVEGLQPYGPKVDLISDKLPPEISKVDFSEKGFYLEVLLQSDPFRPLLDYFDLIDLDQLFFGLNENNLDASMIKGVVKMRWKGGEVIPFLPLEFENQELVKLGLPVNEIRNIVTKIDGHSLTKQMRSYLPNVSVVVYLEGAYPGVLPAGEGHYFKFEGWVRNGFIYLPKFDAIQVSLLELSVEPDIVVDISDVLKLFEISGYERFIRENLSVLKIFKGGPNEITAEFKENALLHNLEYTDKLREKYPPKLIGGRLYSPRIEIVAAAERISGAQHLFRIGWITLHDFVVYLDDYGKLKPYRTEEVLPKPNRTIVAVLTVATIAVLLAIFAVIYKYKINPRK